MRTFAYLKRSLVFKTVKTLYMNVIASRSIRIGYLAAAVLVALTAFLHAQPAYRLIEIGPLPKASITLPHAINDSGKVVGLCSNASPGSSFTEAFVYDDGKTEPLGYLSGYKLSRALGINNSDQIVGVAENETGSEAFIYDKGKMIGLGFVPGNTSSGAQGINSAGQVVGFSFTMGKNDYQGVLWKSDAMSPLGFLPGGNRSRAMALNDSGAIVGDSNAAITAPSNACVWIDGKPTALSCLESGSYAQAIAINNRGQILGNYVGGKSGVFLCSGRTAVLIGVLPGYAESEASSINDAEQIVGSCSNAHGESKAFLYHNRKLYDLAALVVNMKDAGFHGLNSAIAINKTGQIVGVGTKDSGVGAFLLTPF
jgi:probable HAF family extracellular repeat protein